MQKKKKKPKTGKKYKVDESANVLGACRRAGERNGSSANDLGIEKDAEMSEWHFTLYQDDTQDDRCPLAFVSPAFPFPPETLKRNWEIRIYSLPQMVYLLLLPTLQC